MSIRHKLTALAYDKRGRLLAVGHNSYFKTHPLQKKYAVNKSRVFLHAELDCLIKASRRGIPHKLVVMRHSKNGEPVNAAPCEGCKRAILDFDVKEVEHT